VYTNEYKKTIGVDFLEKTVYVASVCAPGRWSVALALGVHSPSAEEGRAARSYVDALGEDVRMMVWDTAGQEEFDAMTRTYYRGVCAQRRGRSGSTGPGGAGDGWRAHISQMHVFTGGGMGAGMRD
jgi:hypothetical protein